MGGDHDSTETRVKPTFDAISTQWLHRLLSLPRFGAPEARVDLSGLTKIEEQCWGDAERLLPAPRSLLRWLIQNLEVKPADTDSSDAAKQRRRLYDRDPEAIRTALENLERDASPGNWWVLEGPSHPDVFVATPEAVIVIEGKRTEAGPTTATKWMPCRHQMLRHLDGAHEILGGRRLYGFFIVGKDDDGIEVPALWRTAAKETIAPETLRRSLPHRSDAERAEIANAFLGVTTWLAVLEEFGLPRSVLLEKC